MKVVMDMVTNVSFFHCSAFFWGLDGTGEWCFDDFIENNIKGT